MTKDNTPRRLLTITAAALQTMTEEDFDHTDALMESFRKSQSAEDWAAVVAFRESIEARVSGGLQ